MKKSRFTERQIIRILKEADGEVADNDIWPKHGIRSASCYKWKTRCGELEGYELVCVKELELGK